MQANLQNLTLICELNTISLVLRAVSHENFIRELRLTFEACDGDEEILPAIDAALSEVAFPMLQSVVVSICMPCEWKKEIVQAAPSSFASTKKRIDVRIEYLPRRAIDTLPSDVLLSEVDQG